MKKVLFLHQGAELYGSDMIFVQILASVAASVRPVVVLDGNGPLVERLKAIGGVVVHIHPLGVLRRRHMGVRGGIRLVREITDAVRFLVGLIRRENIELVYTNTIGILSGMIAAALCRVPHITHVHEIITRPRTVARVLASLSKIMSQRVVAVSGPVKSFLDDHSFCRRGNVSVINNGISPVQFDEVKRGAIRREFGLDDDVFLVAMVGRLNSWKGQDVLIKAAAQLKSRGVDRFHVLLFGDVFAGNESVRRNLERMTDELGIENCVTFCGFRNDAASLFVDADVVVVPSILPEPFGLVALEGMAASRPVIGSAHGGLAEIICDGETGILVRPGSAEDITDALALLYRDGNLRNRMGQAGRRRLDAVFSREQFEKEISKLMLVE